MTWARDLSNFHRLFSGEKTQTLGVYPPVNVYSLRTGKSLCSMGKSTISTGSFSIAMLVYQRVTCLNQDLASFNIECGTISVDIINKWWLVGFIYDGWLVWTSFAETWLDKPIKNLNLVVHWNWCTSKSTAWVWFINIFPHCSSLWGI